MRSCNKSVCKWVRYDFVNGVVDWSWPVRDLLLNQTHDIPTRPDSKFNLFHPLHLITVEAFCDL